MTTDLDKAVERPDWMRPDFRYPDPSPEHQAEMAALKKRMTFIDYTAEMQELRDALSSANARVKVAEEADDIFAQVLAEVQMGRRDGPSSWRRSPDAQKNYWINRVRGEITEARTALAKMDKPHD